MTHPLGEGVPYESSELADTDAWFDAAYKKLQEDIAKVIDMGAAIKDVHTELELRQMIDNTYREHGNG